ncbi:uncharacterized protein [Venturia canescens]|uniref:uncharacterized protein n=1 Tax=Venturia canescens TaxID=32260 RepID=UPI001C9C4BEB|nr:uncharacterized protein LOC122412391 [Venturia canescens]
MALKIFVQQGVSLYGNDFVSYNVHGLLHLVDDVERFSPADEYSAFPYENAIKVFRRYVRKPHLSLQQIANRIAERVQVVVLRLRINQYDQAPNTLAAAAKNRNYSKPNWSEFTDAMGNALRSSKQRHRNALNKMENQKARKRSTRKSSSAHRKSPAVELTNGSRFSPLSSINSMENLRKIQEGGPSANRYQRNETRQLSRPNSRMDRGGNESRMGNFDGDIGRQSRDDRSAHHSVNQRNRLQRFSLSSSLSSTVSRERSRSRNRTFQKDCVASIFVTASSDGKTLVVTKINNTHSHICSKELFNFLPQIRGLSAIEKTKARELLDLQANKKLVRQKCVDDFGKQILLKDLSNIMKRQGSHNNLKTTVEKLEKKFGAECHIYEEDTEMKGLFFVTKQMRDAMDAYPEFVGIDGTFKLLNIRAPIYLMVVEDSEGSTEIIAVCILVNEDEDSMAWLLQTFK